MALTPEQVATVKSTVPVVKQYGNAITTTFYRNMLAAHPELRSIFSMKAQEEGLQQAALANAVFSYASYIDDLPKLNHAVERIAQKHASLFIQPEHYPIVGKYLVGAFAEILGNALTPEIADAWIAAYDQLASVFITREKQLYSEAGEWQTWRKFRIAKKEAETAQVTSFYLEPVDGKPLPGFKAGQYVSVQLPIPELDGLLQSRQYSLSVAPERNMKQYRVSVKKDIVWPSATADPVTVGQVKGVISKRLHEHYNVGDEVDVSPPRGEFFFDPATATPDTPVVLISAGVGATPLVSILDSILTSSTPSRPVTWAHAARQTDAVCFGKHVRDAISGTSQNKGNIKPAVFVKEVRDGDKQGSNYEYKGALSLDKLADDGVLHLEDSAAEYFICGGEEWMVQMRNQLTAKGVALDRVHLELFKTGDV